VGGLVGGLVGVGDWGGGWVASNFKTNAHSRVFKMDFAVI